jgi:hypothetical protein
VLRRDAVIDMLGLDINRDDRNQVHNAGDEEKDEEDIGMRNGRKTGLHALFDGVMVDATACNWTKVNVVTVFYGPGWVRRMMMACEVGTSKPLSCAQILAIVNCQHGQGKS